MIEFCTTKRMFAAVLGFLGVSVFVIFMEDYLTDRSPSLTMTNKVVSVIGSDSSKCWNKEEFTVVENCVRCSEFELKANIKPCLASGYYDIINCTKSGVDYRICFTNVNLEERRFFIFIFCSAFLAILFSSIVFWRQKLLDRQMFEKIQRQLGDGM